MQYTSKIECTHGEGVESLGHRLSPELDRECVVACILDCVVDAEGPITVVLNVYVKVTVGKAVERKGSVDWHMEIVCFSASL